MDCGQDNGIILDNTASANRRCSASVCCVLLEHVFLYPTTYELPLLPSRFGHLSERQSISQAPFTSPTSQFRSVYVDYTLSMMDIISEMPDQPRVLPSVFLSTFLRRCFPRELPLVSFEQAFDGLNHLNHIENRKRQQVQAAFKHLGFGQDGSDLSVAIQVPSEHLRCRDQLRGQEKATEALYAQLYIALRRWTMINELRQEPPIKDNCRILLEHLYSSDSGPLQTKQLTNAVLEREQKKLHEYIEVIEVRGYEILEKLMRPAVRSSDATAWPAVHTCLDQYLRQTSETVLNCTQIMELPPLTDLANTYQGTKASKDLRGRKTDSGISFGSISTFRSFRPSQESQAYPETIESINSQQNSLGYSRSSSVSRKSYSTLERLVAEFRNIKARKTHNRKGTTKHLSDNPSGDGIDDYSHDTPSSKESENNKRTSDAGNEDHDSIFRNNDDKHRNTPKDWINTKTGAKLGRLGPFSDEILKDRISMVDLNEIEITEGARLAALQRAIGERLLMNHRANENVECTEVR